MPEDQSSIEESQGSLIARILEYLRERKFDPGDRLPGERHLAEKLGVGRNTMREAFASLITLRVLESRPNSGVYLRKNPAEASFETFVLSVELGLFPKPQELIDAMEVRESLELTAATLACLRRTDEDLEKLNALQDATKDLLAEGGNIVDLDDAFHMALVEASHNEVLLRILNGFYRLSYKRRSVFFADANNGKRSARAHKKIIAAIANRDADAACKEVKLHLVSGLTYWRNVLEKLPQNKG